MHLWKWEWCGKFPLILTSSEWQHAADQFRLHIQYGEQKQTTSLYKRRAWLFCASCCISFLHVSLICMSDPALTVPGLSISVRPHVVFRSFVSLGTHICTHKHCKHIMPGSSNHFINHWRIIPSRSSAGLICPSVFALPSDFLGCSSLKNELNVGLCI